MERGKPPAQPYSSNLKRLDGDVADQRAALQINGGALLYGTASPTTEGSNGDYYIRTTTNFIYGPKAGGVWPSGTSLVGPPGIDGADGTDGADGADGTFSPVANNTIVGNVSGGTAIPSGLGKSTVKTLLGFVEDSDIKTINNTSLIGSGNISISGGLDFATLDADSGYPSDLGAFPVFNGTKFIWSASGLVDADVKFATLLLATGDSITAGQTGIGGGYLDTAGYTYHDVYSDSDTTGLLRQENRAVGGWFLSSVIADAAATNARIAANSGKDIYLLSVAIGRNDGIAPSSDAAYNGGASWIAQYRTYLTNARSAGWTKIAVATITPYSNENESTRLNREAANDRIRGLVASGHADACIDYGSSTTSFMGNTSSHTYGGKYYVDYVHPSRLGHAKMEQIAGPVYNALQVISGQVGTPSITPAGGSYSTAQTITLSVSTSGAAIYYTLDGSTPNATKTLYTGPFSVSGVVTVKAIAIKSGLTDSSVNSQDYTILTGTYWNLPDVQSSGVTISGNRKKVTPIAGTLSRFIRMATPLPATGKYVIEVEYADYTGDGSSSLYGSLGIVKTASSLTVDCNPATANYAKWVIHGAMDAAGAGAVGIGTGPWAGARTFPSAGRTMIAIDMDAGKMWQSLDAGATWIVPGYPCNPVTGAWPHFTFTPASDWYFACGLYNGLSACPAWLIPSTIAGTLPSGYTGLNA